MGRIPEVSRGRLASSVVGTPGIDRSTEAAFQTLAQVSEREFVAQRAQDAKIQQANDTVNANVRAVNFDNKIERLSREDLTPEEYTKRAGELFTKTLGDIKSPRERSFFSTKGSELLRRKNDAVFKRDQNRKIQNIQTGVNSAIDQSAAGIADIFSDPEEDPADKLLELSSKMELIGTLVEESKGSFSAKAIEDIKKEFPETLARAAVQGLMDSNPEQIEGLLDSLKDSNIFTPDQISQFRKDADQFIKRKNQLAKSAGLKIQFGLEGSWASDAAKGEFRSESEIEQAILNKDISVSFGTAYKRRKKSDRAIFDGQNVRSSAELVTKFVELGAPKTGKGKRTFTFNEEVTFEDISLFRQNVMEAREVGNISASDEARYLRLVEPKFQENVQALMEDLAKKSATLDNAQSIAKVATSEENRDALTTTFTAELLDRIDIEENQTGQRLSNERHKELSKKIMDDILVGFQINRGRFHLGQIVTVNGQDQKIVGWRLDGRTVIDDVHKPILPVPLPGKPRK